MPSLDICPSPFVALLQLPVVTVEEIDAPHIASLVEQYHGPWRQKHGAGAAHHAARGFSQVREGS